MVVEKRGVQREVGRERKTEVGQTKDRKWKRGSLGERVENERKERGKKQQRRKREGGRERMRWAGKGGCTHREQEELRKIGGKRKRLQDEGRQYVRRIVARRWRERIVRTEGGREARRYEKT